MVPFSSPKTKAMGKRKNLRFHFSKIFLSSFSYSCKTQTATSQVLDYQSPIPSINHSHDHNSPITTRSSHRQEPSISSKPKPPHIKYPSMCRPPPRCPDTFDGMLQESRLLPNPKISSKQPRCPPVSSARYPLMNYYLNLQAAEAGMVKTEHSKMGKKKKAERREKNEKMKGDGRYSRASHLKKSNKLDAFFHNPRSSSKDGDGWFSSDDGENYAGEHESRASRFFSSFSSNSRSLPSSDSNSNPPHTQLPNRRRRSLPRRRNSTCEVGLVPLQEEEEEEKGAFAVEVKSSSDPYCDFRESMLEMIVERRIFGAQELEKLLECFLNVNSHHHHKLIVEVFAEILETLFPRNGDNQVLV